MTSDYRLYSPRFFQVLLGTCLTMIGVSMQYHFGEFIAYQGHSEAILGWVTGIGACGSIAFRPYAGAWMDRVGCRVSFLAASLGGATANFLFLYTNALPLICVLRVIMVASNATFLTTVAVFAARVAPPPRRAESLGSIGIGGFLGMMTGPAIGDAIFNHASSLPDAFQIFFPTVAGTNLLAGLVVFSLRPQQHRPLPGAPTFFDLVRRYWPGSILMVTCVFTAALTMHMSFLERYAHFRGFDAIRSFFLVYAPTAISLRIVCRRFPGALRAARVCMLGTCGMAVGVLCFMLVRQEWHLVIPALLMGAGHAFVFPSMVDLAAEAMPLRHRGVGTSIALGAGDVGILVGGVAWGQLIEFAGWDTTFVTIALLMWTVAGLYTWLHRDAIFGAGGERTSTASS